MVNRFDEPDGFTFGTFINQDGAEIRYGCVAPKDVTPLGVMVVLPGFKEPIEKYFEVINDMLDRGYAVHIMDWRGQGGSQRYLETQPQKAHSEGFDANIRDLKQFITDIVKPDPEKPLVVNAHSMGAHLALRYMKENPEEFTCAVLTAPMIDIATGPFPKAMAKTMVRFAKAGNYLDRYVPGGADWSEDKHKFETNKVTSDPARFVTNDLFKRNDALQLGDATYGWVYHALQSIAVLNAEDYLKSIKTPILMATARKDEIVSVEAQDRAAGLIPNCKQVSLADAKHEVWMEKDSHRNAWLKDVDAFLHEQISGRAHSPKKQKQHKAQRRHRPR